MTPNKCQGIKLNKSADPPHAQGFFPLDIAKRAVQRDTKKSTRYKKKSAKILVLYCVHIGRDYADRNSPA